MKPTSAPSPQSTTESAEELQQRIRLRAYELYEQRGGESGHELNDWLQAEAELSLGQPARKQIRAAAA